MKILITLILLVLFVFVYKNNDLTIQKTNTSKKIIQQVNKKNLLLEKTLKEFNVRIKVLENTNLVLINEIEKLKLQNLLQKTSLFKNKEYKKNEDIVDFNKHIKKEALKIEDTLNFSLKPEITFDKEKKDINLEGIQVEIKTKF